MDPSGQRFFPTLIPTSSLHMLNSSGAPVFVTAQHLTTESHVPVHQAPPPPKLMPTANLYLCSTANNATETAAGTEEDGTEKTFVELVEKSYKELTGRKIKDTLSSFLPKVPGEVDSTDTHPETMLQDLIEHRPIGGKEFHPLSNQALLGFRLKPGPLPEQFKMDPALLETKHHHRKRKRKHKTIDRSEEGADPTAAVTNTQMPDDACNFIKTDPVPSIRPLVPISGLPGSSSSATVITRNPVYAQGIGATPGVAGPPTPLLMEQRINYDKEKRKKKKNKDKKDRKEKKEKKRKRDKHHGQEAHGPTPSQPTTLTPSLPPHNYTQYTTQYQ